MSYLTVGKDTVPVISLHVQPNAAKSRLAGFHNECLKVAVASPPVDGKANKEVVRFLARLLGISPRHLTIIRGLQSRRKQVAVCSMSEAELRERLDRALTLYE